MLNFWSDFGISLIMSYVLYLIIEALIGGLHSLWSPSGSAKSPEVVRPVLTFVVNQRNGDEPEHR